MKASLIKTIASASLAAGMFMLVQSCTESQGKTAAIPKVSEPVPVRVAPIEKSLSGGTIVTSGRLTTDDETTLAFKTGGIINEVYVKEGDRIRKGQLLATLDLREIDALVSQSKAGLDKAERDLHRVRNLFQDSVATLEQLQNAETAYDVARQQFKASEFNREFSRITAPASGYVLKKFVNAGQVVGVGDPVVKTNGAGDDRWILRVGVSDRDWSTIQSGDSASVVVDAFPGQNFAGTVLRKSGTADPATGAFIIEIRIHSKTTRLASGMFASAEIDRNSDEVTFTVPYEAVLDANGSEGFVFVTADHKTAVRRPVVIDSFDGKNVRVKSGLKGGESLIISGSAYLTDQSPIIIVH